MTLNLTTPRPDIVYLRRRLKRGESLPKTSTSSEATSTSLFLAPPESENSFVLPEKPALESTTVLTNENPVVRLDARQSAIGSIQFDNADHFGWESGKLSGMVYADDSNTNNMPSFSNRKLAEFYKGKLVLGLRHAKELRRIIVGASSGVMKMTMPNGNTVVTDTEDGYKVLHISRIGNILEIRMEILEEGGIPGTFSINTNSF